MSCRKWWGVVAVVLGCWDIARAQGNQGSAQAAATNPSASTADQQRVARLDRLKVPTREDLLMGQYGPYRANNDLLSYALKLRVDPEAKTIKGENAVRFQMLEDGKRMQLELTPSLKIDSIALEDAPGKSIPLQYAREERSFFIDFPEALRKGSSHTVVIAYSGQPVTQGR